MSRKISTVYIGILWTLISLDVVTASCTFPTNLTGVWISSDKGILRFNSSFILDYPVSVPGLAKTDLECLMSNGSTHVLRAVESVEIFGAMFNLYTCIDLVKIDESSYVYYQETAHDPYAEDKLLVVLHSEHVTYSSVCNNPDPNPSNVLTLVKNASLQNGLADVRCPIKLLSTFTNISMTLFGATSQCSSSIIDGCESETSLRFLLDSTCDASSTIAADALLHCIFHETVDDVTYLYTWTSDQTLLQTSPFGFICLEVRKASESLLVSMYPEYCNDALTSTSFIEFAISGINNTCDGITTSITTAKAEVTTESSDDRDRKEKRNGWVVFLVISLCLVAIIVVAVVLVHCYRKQLFGKCLQKATGGSSMTNIQNVQM